MQSLFNITLQEMRPIIAACNKLRINPHNSNSIRLTLYPFTHSLTSYTLRQNLYRLKDYLINNISYLTTDTASVQNSLAFEGLILAYIANSSKKAGELIGNVFDLVDRGNTDKYDPLFNVDRTGLAYLPKGITIFNKAEMQSDGFVLDEELTAFIQRKVIRDNMGDPTLDEDSSDKSVSISIYKKAHYYHVYFNKKEPETLRRIIYAILGKTLIDHFDVYFTATPDDPESIQHRELLKVLVSGFLNAGTLASPTDLIQTLLKLFEYDFAMQDANLVKNFSTAKQTALNSSRKRLLENNFEYAKDQYTANIESYARLYNNFIQAKANLDSFKEVEFNSIEVFLNNIKNSDTTLYFGLDSTNSGKLDFIIEEPLIHTDGDTWSKYFRNNNSEVCRIINSRAWDIHEYYLKAIERDVTQDILQKAITNFLQDLLVKKTLTIYTSAKLSIYSSGSDFEIVKGNLNNNDLEATPFPHPHIGSNAYTCWGEATRQITKHIMENDGDLAYLQLKYALQQMTASDSIIARSFVSYILDNNYFKTLAYTKGDDDKRYCFLDLIKEYIDEIITNNTTESQED